MLYSINSYIHMLYSINCTIFGYDLYICMVVTKQCGCDAVHNDIVQYNEVCNTE